MWSDDQKSVAVGIVCAVVLSGAFLYLGYIFLPPIVPVLMDPMERLAFLIRCEVFSALPLLAGIIKTALGRFTDSSLFDGSKDSLDTRYVRNTTEQLLLAYIAHGALVLQMDPTSLRIVPLLIAWFVIARLAFWIGYHKSPPARTFGFCATFYPTIGVLLFDVYLMFR